MDMAAHGFIFKCLNKQFCQKCYSLIVCKRQELCEVCGSCAEESKSKIMVSLCLVTCDFCRRQVGLWCCGYIGGYDIEYCAKCSDNYDRMTNAWSAFRERIS
jgi:hypothetical protein